MDTISPARRSALMSRIRSKNTRPELVVRKIVHALGFRYRLHHKLLPGKPDLVFPARRKVIFVHGCFWHGHTCILASKPKSNVAFWVAKITGNRTRDAKHRRTLRKLGWRSLVMWECDTRRQELAPLERRIIRFLEDEQ